MKVLNNRPDEGTVLSYWQKVVARADSHVLSRDFIFLVLATASWLAALLRRPYMSTMPTSTT